MNIRYLIKGIN